MKIKSIILTSLLALMPAAMQAQKAEEPFERSASDTLYNPNYRLLPGMECPQFSIKDHKNKVWTRDDFKGRILVLDCWATWCSACIAKLPAYVELAKKYEGDKRIQFITLSIDKRDAYKAWLYKLPKLGLLPYVNLLAPSNEDGFPKDFQINGVPRYIIIGPDSKIINHDAPSAHDGLEEIIAELLKK